VRAPANDIEHGVLRGNAASPASPFVLLGLPQLAGRTFKAGDPRLAQARPCPRSQRRASRGHAQAACDPGGPLQQACSTIRRAGS